MKINRWIVCGLFLAIVAGCSSEDDSSDVEEITPHLNVSDSIALIKIYSAIGPWAQAWNLDDITTWNGVTVTLDEAANELRVTGLEVYSGNGLHGQIPVEIGQLTELRTLVLSGGPLGGTIPQEIGNLVKLEKLSFDSNDMTGGIPESIGNLKKLKRLTITNTFLDDTIPESIGNLVSLQKLFLFDNRLTGNIPRGLANLNSLKSAVFNNNQLSGVFPVEILKGKTTRFSFWNNNITELPFDVWSDDSDVIAPDLQGNRLSGVVPEWVFASKKWQEDGLMCTRGQQEGYGYSNVNYEY